MSENQNIEAKLCSYVEGDLDAAGRAEVEQYLLANPEYRPLLAQLAQTRGMIRDLPRASAPADLLEALSSQIERSALLGSGESSPARITSNRMPQLAAWAAVLLLTGGLAAVVYRVLPSNKTQPTFALTAAPLPVSATQSSLDAISAAPSATPMPNSETSTIAAARAPTMLARAATAPNLIADTLPIDSMSLSSVVGGQVKQVGNQMNITLRASDVAVANNQVTRYLATNSIAIDTNQNGQLFSTTQEQSPTSAPAMETMQFAGSAAAAAPSGTMTMTNGVIVAREVTAAQAKKLTSDFALQDAPSIAATEPQIFDGAAASTPLAFQIGQPVRIIARDNGLPGVEAMNESQTIDPDGNISLPLVGKLKAAGMTRQQLADAIPKAYQNAKSPTVATWAIEPVLPTTATAIADSLSLVPTTSTTSPTVDTSATSPASSGLLVPTIQNAMGGMLDDRVNVKITIVAASTSATQPLASPTTREVATTATAPSTGPSSAPSTAPATMPTLAPAATMP